MARRTSFNMYRLILDNHIKILTRLNVDSANICNIDETGIITTVQKPNKVVKRRSFRQFGRITSAERGSFLRMALAVNGTGNDVSPFLIFPKLRYRPHFVRDVQIGCDSLVYPSGWMAESGFMEISFNNYVFVFLKLKLFI